MPKLTGSLTKYPARASFAWYLGMILVGGCLLAQSPCHVPGRTPVSLLDGLFTATSALCVTGLSTRSTEFDFSTAGQFVILVLIQLGGIGIMTVTSFVMFSLGGRADLRHRQVVAETLGGSGDLRWVLRNVLATTAIVEGIGALLLAVRNLTLGVPLGQAIWRGLFHSVSAFNNAGFALHDDNLMQFQHDWLVNLTIAALIVIGGIGFPVILDVKRHWKNDWRELWDHLNLHSKLMLLGTASLLLLGTVVFLVLEWNHVLDENQSLPHRLLLAWFHSVTCRTAGFNTVDVGALTSVTLFISILLMLTGAGPCSTAGGFKVSTLAVMVLRAWSTFRGFGRISVFRRTLPNECVSKSITTMLLFSLAVVLAVTCLMVVEQSHYLTAQDAALNRSGRAHGLFLEATFECASAMGTVGLSTGLTPHLTSWGKLVIMVLMFLGRLGPFSVFVALSGTERDTKFTFASEEPMIG